jgi:hypothetical protein
MKRILLALTALSLLTSTAWAGRFEIVGEGTASVAAEFIRVKIQIQSECHSSALSSRREVDQLAQKTVQILEKYKSNIPAQIGVSPEANEQSLKTAYINGQQVVICDAAHSWTSSTNIQFKLDDLQHLAQLQDDLLQLNAGAIQKSAPNTETLTLTLSKPEPGVLAETWDTMSDLALQRAHQNALRQVRVLSLGLSNPRTELIKVEAATSSSGRQIYDRVDTEGDTSGISLGSVSVKLARKFTFKVDAQ